MKHLQLCMLLFLLCTYTGKAQEKEPLPLWGAIQHPLYLSVIDTTEYYFGNPAPAFKTNGLGWAVLLPNLEVEFYFGKSYRINHYSLVIDGCYTNFTFGGNRKTWRLWSVSPELRYYPADDNSFTGHYFGVYLQKGGYSVQLSENGRQGDFHGIGISYGWVKPISKHLDLELGIAAGWLHKDYRKYGSYIDCFPLLGEKKTNTVSVTKLKLSIIYRY